MIVCDTSRVVFVHVQKTGGSTVEQVLRTVLPDAYSVTGLRGGRHATWAAAGTVRPELLDYFTFGFVRNPWARMHSWYLMVQRRGESARDPASPAHVAASRLVRQNPFYRGVLEHFATFESFVVEGPERFPRLRVPQLGYLEHGGRRAPFVGRTEQLVPDLTAVLARLGAPPGTPIPRVNARADGSPDDYRAAYSRRMREIVRRNFARDIEAFGYEF